MSLLFQQKASKAEICFVSILVVFSGPCSCQTSGNDQDDAGENYLPTIGGSPAGSVVVGETYSFTPTASNPDDDTLDFSIDNKPDWAVFDPSTGNLAGSPTTGDIGTYPGILIYVSDGQDSASLAAFSIMVLEASSGDVKNHTGIPLPHVLLTHDPDDKGRDWQANPDPWPSDPRTVETPSPARWMALQCGCGSLVYRQYPSQRVWAHNNLFWSDANFSVHWSGTFSSLTEWESVHSTHVYDNIHADPLLANTLTTWPERDYSLMAGSPALGSDAGHPTLRTARISSPFTLNATGSISPGMWSTLRVPCHTPLGPTNDQNKYDYPEIALFWNVPSTAPTDCLGSI